MPWLTLLALLPLIGAALLIFIKGPAAKSVALAVSLIAFAISVLLLVQFQPGAGVQFSEVIPWIKPLGVHYALGLDGIGLTLVLLVTVVTPVVIIASWNDYDGTKANWMAAGDKPAPAAKYDSRAFFALILAVEGLALYLFLATDVFMFYVLFEVILLPMYFLIGGFGGHRRNFAAAKFLIFGLLGGFVMLASVIGLYVLSAQAGEPSYLLSDLSQLQIPTDTGRWLFVGFMFAFALKAPMVPGHTWLPDAAEQSNPGGATMMVGIMDKLGTFGMIRFCLGLFPEASTWATPVVLVLAVISVLYGAIAAIGSRDMMRLIAYTSISHFGFIVMGIFAFTSQSLVGSTFYMLNHGLSTAGLFLAVGYFIRRRGSRDIYAYGGVQKIAPVAATLFLFSILATASLPGMSNFVSEFMVMAGTFSAHPSIAVASVIAIVLAALYGLWMYQRTMTGPVTPAVEASFTGDLDSRERLALAPVVILILLLGIFPRPMLNAIEPSVEATMQHVGVSDPQPWVAAEGGR